MLFDWLDAREATTVGTTLADDFVTHAASESRPKNAGLDTGSYLEKFAQKFLPRVDREARPLKLNLIKRAALANSFKWRLLEKGVEQPLVDELTQALVLRLTSNQGSTLPSGKGSGGSKRDAQDLHTRGHALLGRGEYAEAREYYQDLVNLASR